MKQVLAIITFNLQLPPVPIHQNKSISLMAIDEQKIICINNTEF